MVELRMEFGRLIAGFRDETDPATFTRFVVDHSFAELNAIERLVQAGARVNISPADLALALERRPATLARIVDEVCGRRERRDRSAYMRDYHKRRKHGGGVEERRG